MKIPVSDIAGKHCIDPVLNLINIQEENKLSEEKPMLDLNKPVQTRSGMRARILSTDLKSTHNIVAAIDKGETVMMYTKDGLRVIGEITENDLINVPEKKFDYTKSFRCKTGNKAVFIEKLNGDFMEVAVKIDNMVGWEVMTYDINTGVRADNIIGRYNLENILGVK